jgi:hypothetical protein
LESKEVNFEEESSMVNDNELVPLYRLAQGLKRIELRKLRVPDSSYNKTARDINIEPSQIITEKTYREQMREKDISDNTLLDAKSELTNQLLKNRRYKFTGDEERIVLRNNKVFRKLLNPVYPAEFTAWVSNVDLYPENRPDLRPHHRGAQKKWHDFPQLVEEVHLLLIQGAIFYLRSFSNSNIIIMVNNCFKSCIFLET